MPIEKINLKSNTIEYGQLAPLRNQMPNREPTKYVTKGTTRYRNINFVPKKQFRPQPSVKSAEVYYDIAKYKLNMY